MTASSAVITTATASPAATAPGQRLAGLTVPVPVEIVRVIVRTVALEEVLGLVLGVEVGAVLVRGYRGGSAGQERDTGDAERQSG